MSHNLSCIKPQTCLKGTLEGDPALFVTLGTLHKLLVAGEELSP